MQKFIAQQVSGYNEQRKSILAVVVKQTYTIHPNGICTLADEQKPLVDDVIMYSHNKALLQSDIDLYTQKKYCDVVVKGYARSYSKVKKFNAEIIIGNRKHTITVQGNQKAYLNNYGKIQFADIETVEEVPLQYDFAYGGKDLEAEKQIQLPPKELLTSMPDLDLYANSPFRYPRNPEGKGYLVEKSKNMVEQLQIPNLQDPANLLTPENILVGDINRWFEMPVPYATDWVNPVWVPRLIYTGLVEFPNKNTAALKEMRMRWVEPDIYDKKEPVKSFNTRFFNGGHYALQIDVNNYFRECILKNIHPSEKTFVIKLPASKPRLWVDGRKGLLIETKPVMHTILIEPDESSLSIVWCGSAPALRPYMPEELKAMPYKVEL